MKLLLVGLVVGVALGWAGTRLHLIYLSIYGPPLHRSGLWV